MAAEQTAPEPDLAESTGLFGRRLMAIEEPILREAGVSMWEYAILTTLARGGAVSQVELSRRTGRDTTRLGKHLGDLEARELVAREQSADARRRIVTLTAAGEDVQRRVRLAVRTAEDDYLSTRLSVDEAAALRSLLARAATDSAATRA